MHMHMHMPMPCHAHAGAHLAAELEEVVDDIGVIRERRLDRDEAKRGDGHAGEGLCEHGQQLGRPRPVAEGGEADVGHVEEARVLLLVEPVRHLRACACTAVTRGGEDGAAGTAGRGGGEGQGGGWESRGQVGK